MAIETLKDTIAETDQGMVNGEDINLMSTYPPSYSAGSCPSAVENVTVNQTIVNINNDKGAMKTDKFTDITGKVLTLSFTPLDSYPVEVSINGLDQDPTTDFAWSGTTITLVGDDLVSTDIVLVRYAYEVTT